jgi:hypothetical protein
MATDLTQISAEPQLFLVGPGGVLPLDRTAIESLKSFSIGFLDIVEPDADVEPNGDELDGSSEEEDIPNDSWCGEPGCPVADPGEYSIEERHGRQPELKQSPVHEDAEDDDGGGDCTDDESGFDKGSRLQANIRGHGWLGGSGAGCPINGDIELNGDEGDYTQGVAE